VERHAIMKGISLDAIGGELIARADEWTRGSRVAGQGPHAKKEEPT